MFPLRQLPEACQSSGRSAHLAGAWDHLIAAASGVCAAAIYKLPCGRQETRCLVRQTAGQLAGYW